jgi:membrane dipeptidase
MSKDPKQIYDESIIIDACSPLASEGDNYKRYLKGGVTVIAATVFPTGGYLAETISGIAQYYARYRADDRLKPILTVNDIYEAKKEKKLGIMLAFQGTSHLQANISLIEIYYNLGIRQMMLCYNTKNPVGDGCEERTNAGLSRFGEKAIKEMNRLGVLVDLSHTGYTTTMEAMEVSEKPVVFSHGNARGVYNSMRNLTDEQVIKVAKMGGTVGVNGYPAFISSDSRPKVNAFIDHIDYYVNLVGIDHVALGLDYYQCQAGILDDVIAKKIYDDLIAAGQWSTATYPPPPYHYPEEIKLPELLPNLAPALAARGYAESDIKKILGENYLRVLKEVWK